MSLESINLTNLDLKMLINFQKLRDFCLLTLSSLHQYLRCPQAFYANDSQLSKRKASFGYGKKSDFTKTLTCSPSSTKY